MTAATASERPPSLWEDLLEIFYAPAAVFERRRETPAFGLALLVFVVLIVALFFAFKGLMQPIFDAEYQRGMAAAMKQNPNLTPEMMERGKAMAGKFVVVGVAFYAIIAPLFCGVVLWFAGKLLDSKAEIGQVMMVTTYAMFPRVLEAIVNAVQTLVLPESSLNSRWAISLGVARFLDPDKAGQLLLAVVGRLDVFTIWLTVIMAIGLSVVGKIPRGKAAIAAAIVWVVGALPAVIGALRAGG